MKTNETEQFIGYLKRQQFSPRTIITSKRVLNFYQKWITQERIEPEQVSYQDMLGFMKYCSKKGISQKTIQHYLNTVKHYYNHLEEQNRVTINPTQDIEVKGIKRQVLYHIIESHELHKLYNEYPNNNHRDKRNKVILGLLVYQGILMQLESHQVMDMYDYVLQTRPEILQMNPKRKSQQKQETDKLFTAEGGNIQSVSNLMTQLMIKVRKINPSVLNAKQIRASVITKWVKQYNLRKAQYLAGHRYISSTENYLQNDIEGLKEEIQQFHPLG